MNRRAMAWLLGLGLIFVGERSFQGGARWVLDGVGVLLLGWTLLQHHGAIGRATSANRAFGHRLVFRLSLVALLCLPLYFLTTDQVVDMLALSSEAEQRWLACLQCLCPILALVGSLPAILVDHALDSGYEVLEQRLRYEQRSGLIAALALSLVFPVNYIASSRNEVFDVTYFRTTAAGTATQALVADQEAPVRAVLFFAPNSEVLQELRPYFSVLESENLEVEVVDQAVERALAEELGVRDNGTIAFVRGEQVERVRLGTDLDAAKDDLAELDAKVNEALMALASGQRIAYFTIGHGEAHAAAEDPLRKTAVFKQLLEAQGFRVKNLGLMEGLGTAVPEDASVVIIAGPEDPFETTELESLQQYLRTGGRLLLLLEPEGEAPEPLLADLGVSWSPERIVSDRNHLRMSGGLSDRELLLTNRFSSHPSVATLSRNSRILTMIATGAGSLEPQRDGGGSVTVTVRSMPEAWNDLDGDYAFDDGEETRRAHELAVISSGEALEDGSEGFRAAVVADSGLVSDPVLRQSRGTAQYLFDTMLWLVGKEELAGERESEEDVEIVHSREENRTLFLLTIFGMPLLLGGAGFMRTRLRRRRVR